MTGTIAGKIAKASADLGNRLKADKKNTQGGGYAYISADKLIAEAGAVLAANGVAVFPSIIGYNVDGGESSGGKRNFLVTINFMMVVTDGESSMDCPWVGAGVDYGAMDKALYKGITSGHKYFLAKLLNIGEGNEDGEHEAPPSESQNGGAQHATRTVAGAATNGTATGKVSANGSPANGDAPATVDERDKAMSKFHAVGTDLYGSSKEWNAKRHEVIKGATKGRVESSKDMTTAEIVELTGILEKRLAAKRAAELDAIKVATSQEMAH